jgi:hypothetical protein
VFAAHEYCIVLSRLVVWTLDVILPGQRKKSLETQEVGSLSVPSSPAVNRASSYGYSSASDDVFAFAAEDYSDIQEQDTGMQSRV